MPPTQSDHHGDVTLTSKHRLYILLYHHWCTGTFVPVWWSLAGSSVKVVFPSLIFCSVCMMTRVGPS